LLKLWTLSRKPASFSRITIVNKGTGKLQ